jgi:hypothetical protein
VSEDPSIEDACAAVEALLAHFRATLVPALANLSNPDDRVIQAALLARAVSLTEATLVLAKGGYGREAMMLNRASFELTLDAEWAAADSERAGEHFVAFARLTQQLEKDVLGAWPDIKIEPGDHKLDQDELQELRKRFGRYGERGWTGLSVRDRLDSLKPGFEERQRKEWEFVLDVIHRWNNAELHPSSWSLARALRKVPLPQGGHKLQFRPASEPELAPFALQVTWWAFLQHLALAHEMLGLDTGDLEDVAAKGAGQLGLDRDEPNDQASETES